MHPSCEEKKLRKQEPLKLSLPSKTPLHLKLSFKRLQIKFASAATPFHQRLAKKDFLCFRSFSLRRNMRKLKITLMLRWSGNDFLNGVKTSWDGTGATKALNVFLVLNFFVIVEYEKRLFISKAIRKINGNIRRDSKDEIKISAVAENLIFLLPVQLSWTFIFRAQQMTRNWWH